MTNATKHRNRTLADIIVHLEMHNMLHRQTIGISLDELTDHEYKDKVLASTLLGEISRLSSSTLRSIY